jgi:GNAT superfamily N-acetyltransferase
VTASAYAEFGPFFDPADWRDYAATLPDTAARVAQGELLVAVDSAGSVVGTVTLYLTPQPTSGHWRTDDAVIRFLAVLPGHRGEGIGGALLRECLERAAAAGCRRLALQTTPPMIAAIHMYERSGFYRDTAGDMVAGSFVLHGYAKDLTSDGGSPGTPDPAGRARAGADWPPRAP